MNTNNSPLPQPVELCNPEVEDFISRLSEAVRNMDLEAMRPDLEALRILIDDIQWSPHPSKLPSPILKDLWNFWRNHHRSGAAPSMYSLIDEGLIPAELRPFCMLVEPANAECSDFRYFYYGSGVVGAVGKDWSGKKLSDMIRIGTAGLFYMSNYRAVLVMKQPLFAVNISAPRINATFWNRLVLPWLVDDRVQGFLVGDVPTTRSPRQDTIYPDVYKEESHYLTTLLEESPLGVGIFVHQEEFVFCNAALAQSLGTTTKILERRHPAELFQDPAVFHQQMSELHGGLPVTQRECALRRDDDTTLWAMISYKLTPFNGLDAVLIWVVDVTERRRLEENLRRLATVDDLTGLNSRREFFNQANQELARARRHEYPCTLAVVDVDHFKVINDQHGHATGDKVLKALATAMADHLRQGDLLGRLGGEEFGFVLPHADVTAAREVMERVRHAVETLHVPLVEKTIRLTISVGLSEFGAVPDTLELALNRADKALYHAKEQGRNQACVFEG